VSFPLKRPKGKRDWVKRVVARWARRHRIAISPRRAETCWKEYRSFEREQAAAGAGTVTEEPAPDLSIDEAAAALLAPASEQAPEPEPPGQMYYMPPTPPTLPLTAEKRQGRPLVHSLEGRYLITPPTGQVRLGLELETGPDRHKS
jgi:hypothetical protein